MKHLLIISILSLTISQELKVEGDLNVTGAVINDSLLQVDGNAVNNTSSQNKRSNISLGLFNSRTGLSLIGLSYDIYQDNRNEIFIGGGTALLAFTGSIGWKHYFSDTYNNNINVSIEEDLNNYKYSFFSSPFVVVSCQAVAHLGFSGFAPTVSPGYEIRFSKYFSTQLGCNLIMIMTDRETEFGLLPFLNMDIHF